jgi:hypothetical protein
LWLARGSDEAWRRREFGLVVVGDYQVRELLDRSRYLYGMHEFVSSAVGAQETIVDTCPLVLYECAEETFEWRYGRVLTPAMAFLEDAGYGNFVITMSNRGRWALEPASDVDPRRFREPWEVLMGSWNSSRQAAEGAPVWRFVAATMWHF